PGQAAGSFGPRQVPSPRGPPHRGQSSAEAAETKPAAATAKTTNARRQDSNFIAVNFHQSPDAITRNSNGVRRLFQHCRRQETVRYFQAKKRLLSTDFAD